MLDLAPTHLLKQRHATAYRKAFGLDGAPASLMAITSESQARKMVAWGEERDAIQATRPVGCWCLGLGGRAPSMVPIWPSDPEQADCEYELITLENCGACAEGAAASDLRYEMQRKSTRSLRERRLNIAFASPALCAYRLAHVATVDVLEANSAAFEIAVRWGNPVGGWKSEVRSLLITGPVGAGKTHLAAALVRQRIELGSDAWFVTLADLLQQIRDTYDADADAPTSAVLHRAESVDLLVLDGIGDAAPVLSTHDQGRLLQILNARGAAQLPVLATTNLSSGGLLNLIGERAVSRLIGMCGGSVAAGGLIVEWAGRDRRLVGLTV